MRLTFITICLLLSAACTAAGPSQTAPDIQPALSPVSEANSLPPQFLPEGRCGLFLFGVQQPYAFTLFEDETLQTAKILHNRQIYNVGVTPHRGAFVAGERFRRVYQHQANNRVFTLIGEVGEETGSGPRLENVLLRVRETDGVETVMPLGGVRSCRRSTDPEFGG